MKAKIFNVSAMLLMVIVTLGAALAAPTAALAAPHAWDCSKYNFRVLADGTLQAENTSNSNEASQSVGVFINNVLKGFYTVPALAKHTNWTTFGSVDVPYGMYTWKVQGLTDCSDSGSNIRATQTPTPTTEASKTPKPDPVKVDVCHHDEGNGGPNHNGYTINNVSIHSVEDANGVGGHGDHELDSWPSFVFNGVTYEGHGNFPGPCGDPTATLEPTATTTATSTDKPTATTEPTNTSEPTVTNTPTVVDYTMICYNGETIVVPTADLGQYEGYTSGACSTETPVPTPTGTAMPTASPIPEWVKAVPFNCDGVPCAAPLKEKVRDVHGYQITWNCVLDLRSFFPGRPNWLAFGCENSSGYLVAARRPVFYTTDGGATCQEVYNFPNDTNGRSWVQAFEYHEAWMDADPDFKSDATMVEGSQLSFRADKDCLIPLSDAGYQKDETISCSVWPDCGVFYTKLESGQLAIFKTPGMNASDAFQGTTECHPEYATGDLRTKLWNWQSQFSQSPVNSFVLLPQ